MRRHPLSRRNGNGVSDITDLYKSIALDLKKTWVLGGYFYLR